MIAFDRARNAPRKIYLWSDFDQFSRRKGVTLFEMPSDAELLKISALWQNSTSVTENPAAAHKP
jgi:hypothetical protein